MINVAQFQQEIFHWAIEKGWWPLKSETRVGDKTSTVVIELERVNIPEKFCLMHEEISEALGDYRDNRRMNEIYYEDADHHKYSAAEYVEIQREADGQAWGYKPCGVPIELADCIIRILDFSEAFGIDMEWALRTKQDFNKTRPYRHGGRKA